MEMVGKILRMYFRGKMSLHQIARRTGLSRNTIRNGLERPKQLNRRIGVAQPSTNSVDLPNDCCWLGVAHR